MNQKHLLVTLLVLLAVTLTVVIVEAQGPRPGGRRAPASLAGNGFTYQGQLKQNSALVNGTCDFQFSLWDADTLGAQVGSTQTVSALNVINGLFTTPIDFGANAFTGDARWLAALVRCPTGVGSYTALLPRQALKSAPTAFALPGLYTQQNMTSTNIIGGNSSNTVSPGVWGATIGGGGAISTEINSPCPECINSIGSNYGTIGGGYKNTIAAYGSYATIGGGGYNSANFQYATISGGQSNNASHNYATIGGGYGNIANGFVSIIGGGGGNKANNNYATIGGGEGNTASGDHATIGGGKLITASNQYATVGGGNNNTASGSWSTIGGGVSNITSITATYATVGGGQVNSARGDSATIAGGTANTVSVDDATIGGGFANNASGFAATIGGGETNTASGSHTTIGGGETNLASGSHATIGGGVINNASGAYSTIGGGNSNTASGTASTVGGGEANYASGEGATIPGGEFNTAVTYTLAAGRRAKANHQGAFVWGDSTDANITSTVANQFLVRASGGITMYTDSALSTGVRVLPGSGTWASVSDRNAKTNFASADGRDILTRLVEIPVQTWNYKTQDPSIRHIGPMAQDFYAAFSVGEDDKHIATIDSEGVALAAIQGLYQMVQEKDAEIEKLKAESEKQETKIENLEARMAALEQASGINARTPSKDWNAALAFVIGAIGVVVFEHARKGASK